MAGVAALIRSAYPRLAPAQVAQALLASAQHRPAGGYSPSTGFGEVDAVAALHAAGRLAAARPAAGLAARGHFGHAAGPVQVTHRAAARIAVLAGVAAAGTAGVIIALVVLTVLTVRTVRDRRRLGAAGPPGAAGPFGVAAPAPMRPRNVGLIELLGPADPPDPAGPTGPDWPAAADREPGTETGP